MPRRKTAVKNKAQVHTARYQTGPGVIDLHFHGAFGIDLMTAAPDQLDELAARLLQSGISAFCPTTLSVPRHAMSEAVSRLGTWIESRQKTSSQKTRPMAYPLGLHLEGPFIHPEACGAHPPGSIRALDLKELEELWILSRKTLKILTLAPEMLSPKSLKDLVAWAKTRKIVLSAGHSRASETEAAQAFESGFSGITHAWNALGFHHRSPGILGAGLGRKGVHVELIIDRVHVAQTLIRWTRQMHGSGSICFVSDCVPAAATSGDWHPFGPLQIRFKEGACRLENGHLAGGGLLLPEAYCRWVEEEAQTTGTALAKVLKESLRHLSSDPLRALRLSPEQRKRASAGRVRWVIQGERLSCQAETRLDSKSSRG